MREQSAFVKGLNQLKVGDVETVKERIMTELGIKSRQAFWSRLNGYVEPKMSEIKIIEAIFAEYKVKNIWGL